MWKEQKKIKQLRQISKSQWNIFIVFLLIEFLF